MGLEESKDLPAWEQLDLQGARRRYWAAMFRGQSGALRPFVDFLAVNGRGELGEVFEFAGRYLSSPDNAAEWFGAARDSYTAAGNRLGAARAEAARFVVHVNRSARSQRRRREIKMQMWTEWPESLDMALVEAEETRWKSDRGNTAELVRQLQAGTVPSLQRLAQAIENPRAHSEQRVYLSTVASKEFRALDEVGPAEAASMRRVMDVSASLFSQSLDAARQYPELARSYADKMMAVGMPVPALAELYRLAEVDPQALVLAANTAAQAADSDRSNLDLAIDAHERLLVASYFEPRLTDAALTVTEFARRHGLYDMAHRALDAHAGTTPHDERLPLQRRALAEARWADALRLADAGAGIKELDGLSLTDGEMARLTVAMRVNQNVHTALRRGLIQRLAEAGSPDAPFEMALLLLERGDRDSATRSLASLADTAWPLRYRIAVANAFYMQGNHSDAERYLPPHLGPVATRTALALLSRGDEIGLTEVAEQLELAFRESGESNPLLAAWSAQAYESLGNATAAKQMYDAAARTGYSDVSLRTSSATRGAPAARAHAIRMLNLALRGATTQDAVTEAYMRTNDPDLILEHLRRLDIVEGGRMAEHYTGQLAVWDADKVHLEASLRDVGNRREARSILLLDLAARHRHLGELDEAERCLLQVSVGEHAGEAATALVEMYESQGRHHEAALYAGRVASNTPDRALAATMTDAAARGYWNAGDRVRARAHFDALRSFDVEVPLSVERVCALDSAGRTEEVFDLAETLPRKYDYEAVGVMVAGLHASRGLDGSRPLLSRFLEERELNRDSLLMVDSAAARHGDEVRRLALAFTATAARLAPGLARMDRAQVLSKTAQDYLTEDDVDSAFICTAHMLAGLGDEMREHAGARRVVRETTVRINNVLEAASGDNRGTTARLLLLSGGWLNDVKMLDRSVSRALSAGDVELGDKGKRTRDDAKAHARNVERHGDTTGVPEFRTPSSLRSEGRAGRGGPRRYGPSRNP